VGGWLGGRVVWRSGFERKWPKRGKKRSKLSSQKKVTVVQCWLTQGQGPDEKFNLSCGQNDQLVHLWVLVPSSSNEIHLWWRSNSTKISVIQNSVYRPVFWYVGGDALIDFHFNIPNTLQNTYSIYEIGYMASWEKKNPTQIAEEWTKWWFSWI
jgi:uncharacterized protein YaeQ